MLMSPIGLPVAELDTPALLLDLDAFEHNVGVMAWHLAARGVLWRPHAKAFKSPAIAHILRRAGAIGMTVAKVSEAEVMAAGGIEDILIAHIVVGPSKAARLAAIQRRAEVKTTVDHPDHLAPLAEAARRAGTTIGILVDVDLGLNRAGVGSPEAAVALAAQVAETRGLRFDGLMGYEGHTLYIQEHEAKCAAIERAIGRLVEARRAVEAEGLPCRIVSAGGTGSYQITSEIGGVTELQAGGGIFACRYYTELCKVTGHRPAITVLATVVSRPTPDRAILDVGLKSLSEFRASAALPDHPDCRIAGLSAEHATVAVGPEGSKTLRIGDKIPVIPGYSDLTFVLHDRVLGHRDGRVESVWELLGRGMLQ
jgi:D-serine deaminase-like pyridoxal phosphate-dependent protein